MKDNNLFASVVLFRELYDNDKDIYDVISQFVLAAIAYRKKWSFDSTEITQILKDTFDFEIPEAVVKTTIKNRLIKENILSFDKGIYSVIKKEIINKSDFSSILEKNHSNYRLLIDRLIRYFEKNWKRSLYKEEQDEVIDNFNSYITDNGVSDKYSSVISSFIIENQKDVNLKKEINAIKEGIVLYNGIRYTSDLNELGSWNSNLTIFLDTEHLFNSVGLNGVLYKELFDDFFNLVNEINRKSRYKNGKKRIELKYFPENKTEIDNFFYVAECIIQGKTNLDPSKTAMIEILNGCKSPSDVINKKAKFYEDLKHKEIKCDNKEYYIPPEYNVEDTEIIDALKKISEEKKRSFDEDECYHFLKQYSKINTLRKGNSSNGFERIGAIFLSGKSVAHFIAHNKNVKFNETDIPFATDIDFITNKFWFRLKKGLSNKTSVPKSFDMVTKAQVVLSTQINNSISEEYSSLTAQYKEGSISKEQAKSYHHELRNKVRKPEEIIPEVLDESLSFLSDSGFDGYMREKSLLEHKAREGEKAMQELKKRQIQDWLAKKRKIKRGLRGLYRFYLTSMNLFLFSIIILIAYIIYILITPQDTILSILSFALPLLIEILTYLKYYKKLIYFIKNEIKKKYRRKLSNN